MSWLDNLKIRRKLQLLLGPLTLLLLVLSGHTVYDRWHQYAVVKSSLSSRELIQLFTDLVYEFQLERGISVSYIASKDDLLVEPLQQQRGRVDRRVMKVREYIRNHKAEIQNAFSLQHAKDVFHQHDMDSILVALDQLGEIRARVNAQDRERNLFGYYSAFNEYALQLIQHFSSINTGVLYMIEHVGQDIDDVELMRRAGAFSTLLWLQEYAGKERALLGAAFASGELDLNFMQVVQGYIATQEHLLNHFYNAVASPEETLRLRQVLKDPSVGQVEEIRKVILAKSAKIDLLIKLKTIIGYGGLIQDLKHYMARGMEVDRVQFDRRLEELGGILQRYRSQSLVGEDELQDLALIEDTFHRYASFADRVGELHKETGGVANIDQLLRVDDAPAIAALNRLQKNLTGTSADDWFRRASKRISLLRQVSDEIGADMGAYAVRAKDAAFTALLFYGELTLVSLAVTLFLSMMITRRLVTGLTNINKGLRVVRDTGDLTLQLQERGDDEIGEMERSFNSLIGERRRVDDALLQTQAQLQVAAEGERRANKAKSEFLSRMSHELRTPMNAILGFAQLLECDEGLEPARKDEVREILKAGAHLLDLINDVLDLARIESGRINVAFEDVDCHLLIAEAMQLVKPLAAQRHITLHYESDADDMALIHVDPLRLKEVVLNLLSNAIKYNREQGEVRVSGRKSADDYYRIEVSDTGAGLSGEQMKQLFMPFERLGAENSAIEGTGIGLVICKRILAAMGGSIGVESVVDQGSTFWIEVRLTGSTFGSSWDQHVVESGARFLCGMPDCKVLYIEDNLSSLRLMAHIFDKYTDIPLISAMTPEEGLELVKAHRPPLVLMDINLPSMDGVELMKLVRGCEEASNTRVVAVSANAMPHDIERALAAGFDDYLTKPVNLTQLTELLSSLLRKSSH